MAGLGQLLMQQLVVLLAAMAEAQYPNVITGRMRKLSAAAALVYLWSLCRWAHGLQLGPSFVTDAGDLRLQQVLDVQNYTAAATSCQAIGGSLMGLRGMSDITGGLYKDALVGSNTGATMWIGLRIRIPPAAPKTAALPKKLPVTARQLQQNWGEGAAEATILMSSALISGPSPCIAAPPSALQPRWNAAQQCSTSVQRHTGAAAH
ncbi:hypothetical protein HaLaN_17140 [Haematococcus lacustris]|uniref:C-type lectin domain-containing protein n=1 Tax=Haematococcus lacustris TaxID=44745 RepID=A0A699ZBL2_HAELA|nr:hypothetical protein HaLaN_17140 [Haematococcus lacustris]